MTDMTMAAAHRAAPVGTEIERWGARAAVAAPLTAVFAIAAGLPIFADDMREAATTGRWTAATGGALVTLVLLAVALLGLHRAQERAFSAFGHASMLVALVGTLLAAGGAWDSVFTVPYLAEHAPAVLDRATDGSLLAGYISSYLVFAAGWACFAVATLRARVLARGPAIALLVGAVLAILPAPTAIRILVLSVAVALLATRRR